jgi:hypothetical protein
MIICDWFLKFFKGSNESFDFNVLEGDDYLKFDLI